MMIWRLWAQKLINTILAEFGFFPPKKNNSIVFRQFCLLLLEKIKKIKYNGIKYFISFFTFFSKTVGLSSVFNAEMNSACQITLLTAFLWDLQKKTFFPRIFALTNSMAIWRLWAQKLINTILAEFDFFPPKKT